MEEIHHKFIAAHSLHNSQVKIPTQIDYFCPRCGQHVTFGVAFNTPVGKYHPLLSVSRCSRCSGHVNFFYCDYKPNNSNEFGQVFMNPSSNKKKISISFANSNSKLKKELQVDYESIIEVYNIKQWNATAAMCRRLLEIVVKDFIPLDQQKKILSQNLSRLPTHVNLAKPIENIANLVKEGGNLGAHFDESNVPDEKLATQMVELLEYMLEYLYITPTRIDILSNEIKKPTS